jgi:hypothetical protein
VEIFLLYGVDNKLKNIVIADNGKGMDVAGLEQYSTFGYSQESRKENGVIDLVRSTVHVFDPRCSIYTLTLGPDGQNTVE